MKTTLYIKWHYAPIQVIFLFFLLGSLQLQAQSISQIEYFFGTDPGVGNATPISVNTNSGELTQSFSIPLGSLNEGFQSFTIRAQDDQGIWSLSDKSTFYITDFSFSNLSALEYWFNNDPGVGNGTPLSISTASQANESFVIPLGTLDVGFHKVGIRAQNTDGIWSLYDKRVFYVFPAEELNTSPLVEMEFLFSPSPNSSANENEGIEIIESFSTTDISIGTGITVPITSTGNPNEYLVEIPTDLVSCEVNNFWVYLENAEGQYSLYNILIDVDVFDDADPTIQTFDNITVQLDENGQGNLDISDVDNGTFDDCTLVSVELNQSVFDYACGDLGQNTVTVTATDAVGKVSTQDVIVTVEDNIAPVAMANSLTIQLDDTGIASISADDLDGRSIDNCSISTKSLDINTFDCSNIGDNTVILTVTDAFGNTDSTTTVVTVEDSTIPTAIAQDITVELDVNGLATISTADVDDGSSDNCSLSDISLDISNFDCSTIGNNTVTLTVTDANGNVDTATAVVTIIDDMLPTIATQDISVELDANGNASIGVADIDIGSSDNCGIASSSLDVSNFDCNNIGDNTVTLTLTDTNGNSNTTTAVVTVFETENPVAIGQDILVELDSNGQASITANDVNIGSTDNCGITSFDLDKTSFECEDVGNNTVVFSVEDGSGNVDSVNVTVTVADNLEPMAVGQDITVDLSGNTSVSITPEDVDDGSFDNCSDVTLSLDIDTFTTLGDFPVTLTVTDIYGNASSTTLTVTVIDTLGVEDFNNNLVDLSIYPNPSSNHLKVKTNASILSYTIIDIQGKVITTNQAFKDKIVTEALADGVYFIKFFLADGPSITKKFIKKSY